MNCGALRPKHQKDERLCISLASRDSQDRDPASLSSTTTTLLRTTYFFSASSSCEIFDHTLPRLSFGSQARPIAECASATMHSTLVRAQNIFGFFTTVAFAIAALIAGSDIIARRTPSSALSVGNVQVYGFPASSPRCQPILSFRAPIVDQDAGFAAARTTTPRKRKNMPSYALISRQTSPASSPGTQRSCLCT